MSEPKDEEQTVIQTRVHAASARSDDSIAGYDTLTPIEVHTADGQVIHTSLAKLEELIDSLRAKYKRST